MKKLIQIVEDDSSVKKLLEITFKEYEFNSISSESKKNALMMFLSHNPDLLIVDLGLSDGDGKDLIKQIREISKLPIIVLTARYDEKEIVAALDAGADDYITKPFNIKELCARVKAVIKRSSKDIDILKVRDIVYKSSNKKFSIEDVEIDLTHLEHDLLLEFIKNKDILMTREHLLNSVWQDSFDKKIKTVNVAIKRLKAKIDPDGKKEYIRSIRGEGYIFC